MKKILDVQNLSAGFRNNKVLHDLSFHVNKGEILIIMGPNGAGKTALLKCIFGIYGKDSGEVIFDGKLIHPEPSRMVEAGMAFVGQGKRIFPSLTVEENLKMGAFLWNDRPMIQKRMEELIHLFPVLKKKFKQLAYNMSGGEQQILSIARALMMNPKLLMLDEPSIGLAPKVVEQVFEKIDEINKTLGISIIVVEHNLKSLLNIAHRGYILAKGRMALEGPIKKISNSKVLEEVFFGELA